MSKYYITWDIGYGEQWEVVNADNENEANEIAYEHWREDAEDSAKYSAVPFTKQVADNNYIEWDGDDEN